MTPDEITSTIHHLMPDAEVAVSYRPGTDDHISIHVVSATFESLKPLDRQRLVYRALAAPMENRRIKACAVRTSLPGEGDLRPGPANACIRKGAPE
ncbi:MAG: BolA/IbaG family iron-sulfur metabolism protein [bacterium]|nr:BolA/IbaG family iron-sulfur metabolism protein [bacterium]